MEFSRKAGALPGAQEICRVFFVKNGVVSGEVVAHPDAVLPLHPAVSMQGAGMSVTMTLHPHPVGVALDQSSFKAEDRTNTVMRTRLAETEIDQSYFTTAESDTTTIHRQQSGSMTDQSAYAVEGNDTISTNMKPEVAVVDQNTLITSDCDEMTENHVSRMIGTDQSTFTIEDSECAVNTSWTWDSITLDGTENDFSMSRVLGSRRVPLATRYSARKSS